MIMCFLKDSKMLFSTSIGLSVLGFPLFFLRGEGSGGDTLLELLMFRYY